MKSDERGSIVVEASISFTMFLSVLAFMIALLNMVSLYSKMEFVTAQVALEMQGYSYALAKTGIVSSFRSYQEDMEDGATLVVEAAEAISSLSDTAQSLGTESIDIDSLQDNWAAVAKLAESPVDTYRSVLMYLQSQGASAIETFLTKTVTKLLASKYLADSSFSYGDATGADAYLLSKRVVDGMDGLDFSRTTILADDDESIITVVVDYEVSLHFPLLPSSLQTIKMTNASTVRAWVGEGDGYSK